MLRLRIIQAADQARQAIAHSAIGCALVSQMATLSGLNRPRPPVFVVPSHGCGAANTAVMPLDNN